MPLVQHGFPDWYRLSGRADEVFLNESLTNQNADVVRGPFFVGAHQSLMLRYAPTLQNQFVFFDYLPEPGQPRIARQVVSVRQGSLFAAGLPVIGPYVQATVDVLLTPAAWDIRLWSAQVAANSMEPDWAANLLVSAGPVNISAGNTRTDTPARVWPGEASWSVSTDATSWSATLQSIDATGGTDIIDYLAPHNHGQRRNVYLPPCNVQILTTNNDAALKAFRITLSARPVWAGA